MYILTFRKNKSKYFDEALSFAKELNCEHDGTLVIINIPENLLLNIYEEIRTLFGLIQNWKSTYATFRGYEVAPYPFILSLYQLSKCTKQDFENSEWGCVGITSIKYLNSGSGNYQKNGRYWYNYGKFIDNKWFIDKSAIREKISLEIEKKGLDLSPLFDPNIISKKIDDLPNYIVPDDVGYRIYYKTKHIQGSEVEIPDNIRHISNKVFTNATILTLI